MTDYGNGMRPTGVHVLTALAFAMLGAIAGAVAARSWWLRPVTYVESAAVVSHLVSLFHSQDDTAYASAYATVLAEVGNISSQETNLGAEILFTVIGNPIWTSDTDHDGRREACDEAGQPFVFLTEHIPKDSIIDSEGRRHIVERPAYCSETGFYINTLSFHELLNHG